MSLWPQVSLFGVGGSTVLVGAANTLAKVEHVVGVPELLDPQQFVVVDPPVLVTEVVVIAAGGVDVLGDTPAQLFLPPTKILSHSFHHCRALPARLVVFEHAREFGGDVVSPIKLGI